MWFQHEDDYMAAKRNLERKRQELIQQKQMEKMKRKSESGTAPEQPEKRLEPTTPTQLHRYVYFKYYTSSSPNLWMRVPKSWF